MSMKVLALLMLSFSMSLWANPLTYLNNFDSKVYSLKTKGVKDFVVDVESSKLTKQMNDQMIFGKVKTLIFRVYWTANPERLAVEVLGLPDGFKEIKDELKLSVLPVIENILPANTAQKFAGYKFNPGTKPKEFVAQDTTGIANVQSFTLRFDNQDRLIEVTGKKSIGSLVTIPKYEKEPFSDGKWVLQSLTTTSSESGQELISRKELKYGSVQGISVVAQVKMITEQKMAGNTSKPLILEEEIEFKNYKLNTGAALKYFLGESQKAAP